MGKADSITKDYMRDPVIFADAFNKFLYHGKQIIKPENLTELDTTEIAIPYGSNRVGVPEQRYRDVLKLMMTDGRMAYCLLGIENQKNIHYAMPVKNGLYDFLQLAHQVKETTKSHKSQSKTHWNNKGDYEPSSDEFLGGFYKTDKLLPVVTLVIFLSPEEWDGPLSLKEMYSAADESIMQYVPDYKVNLIAPERMTEQEIEEFKSSLKEVMIFNKYAKNKRKLQEALEKDLNFQRLDRQAAEVINVTTNLGLQYPIEQEAVDMCLAVQEMVADGERRGEQRGEERGEQRGEQRGEIRGIVETYQEFNLSLQDAVQKVMEKFNLSQSEAEWTVKEYWK